MSNFKTIEVGQLDAMRSLDGFRLIDVRTVEEVATGIIEGAEHIVLNHLPQHAVSIDAKTPTVFYCRSGNRSGQACAFFAARGYQNVYNLQGGVLAWAAAGLPLVKL
ncbi:MAG: rhodanese-like domain-containing protein [Proteobacteria bacterium]|nr:rhodanese-like domain-containing protein [Pseudomonadota bacterium]MDE3207300.1 rhodanese-like domain-containing protein [Pseudomonadota bacterium]